MNLVAENKATAINTDDFTTDDNGMIFSSKTTLMVLCEILLNLTLTHTPTHALAHIHTHIYPHAPTQNCFKITMAIFIFSYLCITPPPRSL